MNETKNISKLFDQLYNGAPWLDVNIVAELKKVRADQAATRILPNCNTIWEIVIHLIGWRENILERLQGKTKRSPAGNYISPVKDTSAKAWLLTLHKLEKSQQKWLALLENFDANKVNDIVPPGKYSAYDLMHGILQHDAYHLGQIVLLAKQYQ
jgi:uncharacterized damage-inducible protein DinB